MQEEDYKSENIINRNAFTQNIPPVLLFYSSIDIDNHV